jgi:hypothetical protein
MAGYGVGRRALKATITGLGGLVVAATTCPGSFIAAETADYSQNQIWTDSSCSLSRGKKVYACIHF